MLYMYVRVRKMMTEQGREIKVQGRRDADSKVHGANMGPIWGREDPSGPYVGSMNFAIWGTIFHEWHSTSHRFKLECSRWDTADERITRISYHEHTQNVKGMQIKYLRTAMVPRHSHRCAADVLAPNDAASSVDMLTTKAFSLDFKRVNCNWL